MPQLWFTLSVRVFPAPAEVIVVAQAGQPWTAMVFSGSARIPLPELSATFANRSVQRAHVFEVVVCDCTGAAAEAISLEEPFPWAKIGLGTSKPRVASAMEANETERESVFDIFILVYFMLCLI